MEGSTVEVIGMEDSWRTWFTKPTKQGSQGLTEVETKKWNFYSLLVGLQTPTIIVEITVDISQKPNNTASVYHS